MALQISTYLQSEDPINVANAYFCINKLNIPVYNRVC